MKMITLPTNLFFWLGTCALLLSGCSTGIGPGGGYGRPKYPPISYVPNPGSPPWYYVGHPRFPGRPSIPVVLNPAPVRPSPGPGTPSPPSGDPPASSPTIPIGLPDAESPNDRSLDYWSPWPLPPRGKTSSVRIEGPLRGDIRPEKAADSIISRNRLPVRSEVMLTSFQSEGADVESDNLVYHGGRLIADLSYVNLYISGDTSWSRSDVEQIDSRLAAAMRDEGLNNVLRQYFNNQPLRTKVLASHPLVGYTPKTVSRGDIQVIMEWLHRQGFLKPFDLKNTVFNLLLPAGTVLTADNRPSFSLRDDIAQELPGVSADAIPPSEEGDSRSGLAGYHGSVVTRNNDRVYYTVNVYSESLSNGAMNGVPIFREPWRNVVATLYHHLAETRTNPDVEEAMRQNSETNAQAYLGWVSPAGLEVGDYPIRARIPLRSVFRDVPLASGQGSVPIQLLYSNAVQGPEGPISQLHALPNN